MNSQDTEGSDFNTRHLENGITVKLVAGNGFWQYLDNIAVEKIWSSYTDETQTFFFRDGRMVTVKTGCTSFNRQIGTPISSDGQKMFLNIWEKGIICYDLMTMSVVWKLRKPHTMHIIVFDDYITVDKNGGYIIKIDMESGKIIDEIKSSTIIQHSRVSKNEVLAYYIKKTLAIIDTRDMSIVKLFEREYIPRGIGPYIRSASVRYENGELKLITKG